MKAVSLLALTVLAAFATVGDSSAIPTSSRANLNVGYIYAGDRLLSRTIVNRRAVANAIQYEDVAYRGNTSTRISAVQAFEVGVTQFGIPSIISGGIGQRNVTVRFTSARGRGYNYQLDIWGR